MLLNRIAFLKAEEAKLDWDFVRTQQRTEEMLLLKVLLFNQPHLNTHKAPRL
jgi:hypothetical protein